MYLIEKIESQQKEKMPHLKAIYFLRPTVDNMALLQKELASPRFGEYFIFTSNSLPDEQVGKLAEADTKDLVKQVQEVYVDYFPINSDLFSLGIPDTLALSSKAYFDD